jgi:hypothetical protein
MVSTLFSCIKAPDISIKDQGKKPLRYYDEFRKSFSEQPIELRFSYSFISVCIRIFFALIKALVFFIQRLNQADFTGSTEYINL